MTSALVAPAAYGLRRRMAGVRVAQRETMGFLPFLGTAAGWIIGGAAVGAAADEGFRDDLFSALDRARVIMANVVATAAPIVGLIPGIGSGIAVMMSAAAALALGKPLSEAMIDAVANAVPGGGLVKAAVYQAASAAKGIIEGDSIEEIGLDQLRTAAKSTGGELAACAFDAGVAIARGEDLQAVGFKTLHHWFRGSELGDKAARFALRVAEAAATGQSVERILINEAKGALLALPPVIDAQKKIDEAISTILREPYRIRQSIEQFAYDQGIPLEIAQAAFMSIVEGDDRGLSVSHGVRHMLRSNVDASTPIQGESERIALYRKWTARKIPLRELMFHRAEWVPYVAKLAINLPRAPVENVAIQAAKSLPRALAKALSFGASPVASAPSAPAPTERDRALPPSSEVPKVVLAAGAVALGAIVFYALKEKKGQR